MPYTAAACPRCRRRMTGVGLSVRRPTSPAQVDYGPTPYLECRADSCAFKVTPKDPQCPNCGAAMPNPATLSYIQSVAFDPRNHVGFLIFAFFATFAVLAPALSGLFAIPFWTAYYLAFMLAPFAIWIAHRVLRAVYSVPTAEEQSRLPSLAGGERRIRERLQEISRREGRILSVFARAKQSKGEDWQAVRRRLEDALTTLRRQQARYSVKLFEIEAVRWQNRLAPFLYGLEELSATQCENRLREVEAARKSGEELRARLSKQSEALGASAEAEELVRKVEETLGSAAKIHEALLSRQAVLTLRELGPTPDALEAPLAEEGALREVEVFNIQVAITDFSSSLEELEAEYARAGEAAEREPGGAGA